MVKVQGYIYTGVHAHLVVIDNASPSKYLCILVPAPLFLKLLPYFYQFSIVEYKNA